MVDQELLLISDHDDDDIECDCSDCETTNNLGIEVDLSSSNNNVSSSSANTSNPISSQQYGSEHSVQQQNGQNVVQNGANDGDNQASPPAKRQAIAQSSKTSSTTNTLNPILKRTTRQPLVFTCSAKNCSQQFESKHILELHQRRDHTKPTSQTENLPTKSILYQCPIEGCGRTFTNINAKNGHLGGHKRSKSTRKRSI